jgi:hypothetical protein
MQSQQPTPEAQFESSLNGRLAKLGFRLVNFRTNPVDNIGLRYCQGWIFAKAGKGLWQPPRTKDHNNMLDLAAATHGAFSRRALKWAADNAHRLNDAPTWMDDPACYDPDGNTFNTIYDHPLTMWMHPHLARG